MIEQLRQGNERFERWMYSNGRPNALAAILNRFGAVLGRTGIWRSRLVTLEVPGRSSGRAIAFPLVVVRQGGDRYLVAMLGERAQWVRNLRAAGGAATLWDGRGAQRVVLEEVGAADRPPILKRYAELAPGGRAFIPVDYRTGDAAAFAPIAGQFPVFRVDASVSQGAGEPATTRRTRRWRRWGVALLVGVAILAVLTFAGVGLYVRSSATPALALPSSARPPSGAVDGRWTVASRSEAGFRIDQTVLGMTGNVAGRTNAVTGSMDISGNEVTAASFRVDLATITSDGKPVRQFDQTLETKAYPETRFTLSRPLEFDEAFVSGATFTTTVRGTLSLHGTTRDVTATISARRDGDEIDVSGAIPIAFADWGIKTPDGFGWLGSVADHGAAEFLLVLRRA